MTRWELITSKEYCAALIDCIVSSKLKITDIRKKLKMELEKYRKELLHGEQRSEGCGNINCKVCYPFKHSFDRLNKANLTGTELQVKQKV